MGSVIRARGLRRSMSLPEVLLWRALRARPGGFRFRRQHPFDGYVLDFYCPEARLAIEVDGMAHNLGDNPTRDRVRDERMAKRSIRTLRIAAGDVLKDLEAAVRLIVIECETRSQPEN